MPKICKYQIQLVTQTVSQQRRKEKKPLIYNGFLVFAGGNGGICLH
jgi:hypothetical protein